MDPADDAVIMSIENAFIVEPDDNIVVPTQSAITVTCHTLINNLLSIFIPLPGSSCAPFHEWQIDFLLVHHDILLLMAISILALWLFFPAITHHPHPMACCLDRDWFLALQAPQHFGLAHTVYDILCRNKLSLGLQILHDFIF